MTAEINIVTEIFKGICNGFGTAVGSYFALKYAIQHMDKVPTVKEKIKEVEKKIEKVFK